MPTTSSTFAFEYFIYVFVSVLFGYFAAIFVRELAPYACGSGIPEVIQNYFQ